MFSSKSFKEPKGGGGGKGQRDGAKAVKRSKTKQREGTGLAPSRSTKHQSQHQHHHQQSQQQQEQGSHGGADVDHPADVAEESPDDVAARIALAMQGSGSSRSASRGEGSRKVPEFPAEGEGEREGAYSLRSDNASNALGREEREEGEAASGEGQREEDRGGEEGKRHRTERGEKEGKEEEEVEGGVSREREEAASRFSLPSTSDRSISPPLPLYLNPSASLSSASSYSLEMELLEKDRQLRMYQELCEDVEASSRGVCKSEGCANALAEAKGAATGLQKQLASKECQLALKEEELANKECQLASAELKIASVEQAVSLLKDEAQAKDRQLASKERQLATAERKISSLEQTFLAQSRENAEGADRSAELASVEAQLDAAHAEVADLEAQLAAAQQARESANRQLADSLAECGLLRTKVQVLQSAPSGVSLELRSLRTESAELRRLLESERAQGREDAAKSGLRSAALQAKMEALQSEAAELRFRLEEGRERGRKGGRQGEEEEEGEVGVAGAGKGEGEREGGLEARVRELEGQKSALEERVRKETAQAALRIDSLERDRLALEHDLGEAQRSLSAAASQLAEEKRARAAEKESFQGEILTLGEQVTALEISNRDLLHQLEILKREGPAGSHSSSAAERGTAARNDNGALPGEERSQGESEGPTASPPSPVSDGTPLLVKLREENEGLRGSLRSLEGTLERLRASAAQERAELLERVEGERRVSEGEKRVLEERVVALGRERSEMAQRLKRVTAAATAVANRPPPPHSRFLGRSVTTDAGTLERTVVEGREASDSLGQRQSMGTGGAGALENGIGVAGRPVESNPGQRMKATPGRLDSASRSLPSAQFSLSTVEEGKVGVGREGALSEERAEERGGGGGTGSADSEGKRGEEGRGFVGGERLEIERELNQSRAREGELRAKLASLEATVERLTGEMEGLRNSSSTEIPNGDSSSCAGTEGSSGASGAPLGARLVSPFKRGKAAKEVHTGSSSAADGNSAVAARGRDPMELEQELARVQELLHALEEDSRSWQSEKEALQRDKEALQKQVNQEALQSAFELAEWEARNRILEHQLKHAVSGKKEEGPLEWISGLMGGV